MPASPAPTCLNCGFAFAPGDRFCARCGQRTDTARLSVPDVLRDLLQTFVGIERGPLAFAWALVTRPGHLAREFVEGKRRRYYGPFATLAVAVGVTALAINLSDYELMAHDGLGPGPETLLQRHFNIVLLAQLPLLGLACRLLFPRSGFNVCEHLVPAAYALSVRAAVVVLTIPTALFNGPQRAPEPAWVAGFWIAWYAYFGWTASQFYAGRAAWPGLRGIVAAVLTHGAVYLLLIGADRAYRSLDPS